MSTHKVFEILDIVEEILLWLPLKPLLQFRVVEKSWNHMIRSQYFMEKYDSRRSRVSFLNTSVNSSGFSHPSILPNEVFPQLNLDLEKLYAEPINEVKILGSSNGFVLINGKAESDPLDILFFVHGLTGERVKVPKMPSPFKKKESVGFSTKISYDDSLCCFILEDFLVFEYQYEVGSTDARILFYIPDSEFWFTEGVSNNGGFVPESVFEFKENLFWVNLKIGLLTWSENGPLNNSTAVFFGPEHLIAFPKWDEANTTIDQRYAGVCEDYIQYLEWRMKLELLSVWRLESDWNFIHQIKLSIGDDGRFFKPVCFNSSKAEAFFELNKTILNAEGFFELNKTMLILDFKDLKLKFYSHIKREHSFIAFKIPKLHTLIPKKISWMLEKLEADELYDLGNVEGAIRMYSCSLVRNPIAKTYLSRALAYARLGNYVVAEEDCDMALKLDPELHQVYPFRAVVRSQLQNNEGCLKDLEAGMRSKKFTKEMKDKMKQQYSDVKKNT